MSDPSSGTSFHNTQTATQTESTSKGLDAPVLGRRLRIAIKISVILLVMIFFGMAVWRAQMELRQNPPNTFRWPYFLLAVLTYIVALVPAAVAWTQALKSFGQRFPLLPAWEAYYYGHLAKYVPGKAMVLIVRAGRLQQLGVPVGPAIVSVFVETLTGVGMGTVIGALFFCLTPAPYWIRIGLLLGAPVATVFLIPHFFRSVLVGLAKSKSERIPEEIPAAFTGSFMLRTCFWMGIGWIINGTSAWLVMLAVHDGPEALSLTYWVSAVAAVSLGAVAGFVSMLPGGAGARELVVSWLLAPLLTQPLALLFAVVLRVVNLIGESASIGGVVLLNRLLERRTK